MNKIAKISFMNGFAKILSLVIVTLLVAAMAVSCAKPGEPSDTDVPTDGPQETEQPAGYDDAPASEEIVGKVNGMPIYTNDFYYFLYQAFREMYFSAEGLYDETLGEAENMAKMKEYFYSEDEDGVKILSKVVDRTLDISRGFKVAYQLGKEASETMPDKYTVSEETLKRMLDYIDGEADYGVAQTGMSRDDYFFYMYGMNVNEAKRYTEQQVYAELHEQVWSDENGYSFTAEMPQAPEAPADDASVEEKDAYATMLAEYETKLAEYKALEAQHYEKFRSVFEEDKNSFSVKTIRYLLLSKTDAEGKALSEDEIAAKRAKAESYIALVEGGHEFEGIVKGFSESASAASDYGLADVCFYGENINNIPAKLIDWAVETEEFSDKPVIVESADAIYLVMLCGITDFDKTTGIVADDITVNPDEIRRSVEYDFLAREYNEFIESKMKEDKYAATDVNRELMEDLATRYLEYDVTSLDIEEE